MKICKRMGAAHAERRKFRKREDRLRVKIQGPQRERMDWTSQSNFENPHSDHFCVQSSSLLSSGAQFLWLLLDRTFAGIQRVDLPRAARTHGGASGPEKKMALKTSGFLAITWFQTHILGHSQDLASISVLHRSVPLSLFPQTRTDASRKTGTDLRGRLHNHRPLQIWQSLFFLLLSLRLLFRWVRGWSPWPRVPKVCGVASRDVYSATSAQTQQVQKGHVEAQEHPVTPPFRMEATALVPPGPGQTPLLSAIRSACSLSVL